MVRTLLLPMGMSERHVLIIGGGVAGLSAGCYALASGFRATIVEHNLALGGVCTAWQRGPYTIDGCLHWLIGGSFSRIYEELGVIPRVRLRALEQFATYRDARDGFELTVTRDLERLRRDLVAAAPEDAGEIGRMIEAAGGLADLTPEIDEPGEPATLAGLRRLWGIRHELVDAVHFRRPLRAWAAEQLRSERLRRALTSVFFDEAPAILAPMLLGLLSRGHLSRPEGGTARLRDALVERYRELGGDAILHATVDEILVEDGRARGVRLADGTLMTADIVISTASAPETTLRLLGGRFGAEETRRRLERWKLFQPIVLLSYGVAAPLEGTPPLLMIGEEEPFEVGGHPNPYLYVRVFNDEPSAAPPGHTVVQLILETTYEWWATRGTRYAAEKDRIAEETLHRLDRHLPGVEQAVRVVDVATPLTFWTMTRSWRGAFEGWMLNNESLLGHIDKRLKGLGAFYQAGQWVEPGGGVPMSLMSGRQVIQLACADEGVPFVTPGQLGEPLRDRPSG